MDAPLLSRTTGLAGSTQHFGMDLTCLLLSSLVTNLRNSMEKDVLDVPSCLGEGKE